MIHTDIRVFNNVVIYGISCGKDSIITRNNISGSSVLYLYPYKKCHHGLGIPEKAKDVYYQTGRHLYKNEIKLFEANKLLGEQH